jgi:multiple sugar transport system substrate-binding protein
MHRVMPSWLRWGLAASITAAVAVAPAAHASRAAASVTLTMESQNGTFWTAIDSVVIKAYTKLHPNVHFKLTTIDATTYPTKMQIQAASGTLPDILETADAFTLPFALHGVVLNMQPFVNRDPSYNIADIYPNFLNLGRVPGNTGLYMIPFSSDAVVAFYNKDMFTAAGVALPTANWTYAQFLSAAQKLTKTDASGKVTQWGLDFGGFWWARWVPWVEGFGGSPFTADGTHSNLSSSGSIAGLQAIQDLYVKYKITVPPTETGLVDSAFAAGKAAMYFHVHGAVSGISAAIGKKFAWDVQPMPSFPSGKHVDGMGTAGYAISSTSTQRAAAWDFVSFIGSKAGQQALGATGANVPVRKSLVNDKGWRGFPLNNDAFITAIKYGITPPQLTPNDAALNCGTVYAGVYSTATQSLFDKIVRGAPVAAAARAADSTINSCIDALGD